jgi:hypothetical protein
MARGSNIHEPPRLLIDDAKEYSRVCETEYNAGDHAALMRVIVASALCKRKIPEWAAEILHGAYGFAVWGELSSWDKVFGKPSPARKSVIQKWARRNEVWAKIIELNHNGSPIDDRLFERVGRELGIGGKTETKRLYANVRDALERAKARGNNHLSPEREGGDGKG